MCEVLLKVFILGLHRARPAPGTGSAFYSADIACG